jgi:ferredoxin
MNSDALPIGAFVRIPKAGLQALVDRLKELGYRTLGPRVQDDAIVYSDLDNVQDLPIGVVDRQDGGQYRLQRNGHRSYFDYVVGPHSLKSFLFPPRETLLECQQSPMGWQMRVPEPAPQPLAFLGPRSCDLHALRVQDRVFLEGRYVDPGYQARREQLFIAAVNCRRAAATCFCHSMKTGPAVSGNFDLSLTELDDVFVLEVGTARGGQVITAADWSPCSMGDIEQARDQPRALARQMKQRSSAAEGLADGEPRQRSLDTSDLHDLLLANLEHPRWEQVAERCLACANCTMVCPTCFCSFVEEVADLGGTRVQRKRSWASCFTAEHSYMNSGTVRKSTSSRYRQWLTHKLATWHDQFQTSGCTGCGRCITWCPVGIDLTEEVAAIRGDDS